jgi:hypothetical protein
MYTAALTLANFIQVSVLVIDATWHLLSSDVLTTIGSHQCLGGNMIAGSQAAVP